MQCELLLTTDYNHWHPALNSMEPTIPEDPRYWTRNDVATWLQYMESEHQLPAIRIDRFFMNGKALCLMTPGMFLDRVPIGGKLLYKDFQLRLARAMYNIELYHS